jgi:large subunit ribosomal protein L23
MGIFGKKKTEEKDEAAVKKDGKHDDAAKAKKEEKTASMKDLYAKTSGNKDKKAAMIKTERKYGSAYRVLIKPLITEKAANLGSLNKYVFEVDVNANKIEVAKAVAEAYGVKPIDVSIINNKGKEVRYGRRKGRRRDWKKAIVSLSKGQKINIYEGV